MIKWLTANPLLAGLIAVALLAAIAGGYALLNHRMDKHDAGLVNQGELQERGASNAKVINDVEAAHNAVNNPTPAERNELCSRYDRNCQDSQ